MGLIKKLFGSREVSLRELKLALLRVERERKRKTESARRLEESTANVFEKTKAARGAGNHVEVDYLWEELKQVRTESALDRRQLRVLNLEAIALKRTVWGVEHLETKKDASGARALFRRLHESGLDDKLQAQEIREEEYLQELDDILADLNLTSTEVDDTDDPEKAAFLAEIDAINAAEEVGATDIATDRQAGLKDRLANEERGA